jgi:ribosomal protein L11 methyltransferase
MRGQPIWKASIITTAEAEDAVAELLAVYFAPSPSSYTDAETGHTIVSAYSITPPKNSASIKSALRSGLKEIKACGLNLGLGTVTIQKLPRKNWAESWKRHFRPIQIGRRLLVKPSWIRRQPKRGQAVIVLDPGLSFGTGQHPTTEYCLRELVRCRKALTGGCGQRPNRGPTARFALVHRMAAHKPNRALRLMLRLAPRTFLDLGTGSGILAISAAKLGYDPVHAFDLDPQCVRVAKANATANRVERKIRITRADLTKLPLRSAKQYDVVCANLLANLLIAERYRILARLKPGGVLVVAGILKREFEEVAAAYRDAGMKLVGRKARMEWQSGTFVRRAP